MPDFMTLGITFVIALIAALVMAYLIGHNEQLADFVNIDQG